MSSLEHAYRLSPAQMRAAHLGGAQGWSSHEVMGDLDRERLSAKLDELIAQNEVLRTLYRSHAELKEPLQIILPALAPEFAYHDLSTFMADDRLRARQRIERESRSWSGNLEQGPVLAITLIREEAKLHRLCLSLPVLSADLKTHSLIAAALLRPTEATLDPDTDDMQFADVSEWLHELLEAPETEEGRAYWKPKTHDHSWRLCICRTGETVSSSRALHKVSMGAEVSRSLSVRSKAWQCDPRAFFFRPGRFCFSAWVRGPGR